MKGQYERNNKAAQTTIPDAEIMRTIIATMLAVFTAVALNNSLVTPKPVTISNFKQVIPAEHVSAAPAEQKTDPAPVQETKPEPSPVVEQPKAEIKPATIATPAPSSTCATEITKYGSWNQTVAYNVMMAESSGNANTLNDNHATGDYSIGCFQINLKGDPNLLSKHRLAVQLGFTGTVDRALLTEWLKDPANNVAIANKLYTLAGQWSDWQYTCQTKVQCY